MKTLTKIEKSKLFWSFLWIAIIFFILRLPSLIEPNWYGDEGIYQIMGRALNHGHMLYRDIWDNKPPLLYLTYALFNGDQFSTRLASLLAGIGATGMFFLLVEKLFANLKVTILTTSLFALLFATPLIEGNIANAENFMLLPIIAAGLLIYQISEKRLAKSTPLFFVVGMLLGIAFLFKIVALFDFVAFFVYLIIISLPDKLSLPFLSKTKIHAAKKHHIKNENVWIKILTLDEGFMIFGFLFPISLTILYFAFNNAFWDFINASFFGNIGYVGYGNQLIIPQGFLILKLLLLAGTLSLLLIKRRLFSKPTLFILIWLSFSLFSAFFSQRPYIHYQLVAIPTLCLLVGLTLNEQIMKIKRRFLLALVVVVVLLLTNFSLYGFQKTLFYYQNTFLFLTGNKDTTSYRAFFDHKTPRDYEIASFLKLHTNPNDPIFIWGNSAQIYVLSNTLPINKYTVAYHITQSKQGFIDTQNALNTVKPKYLVLLYESSNFPFRANGYAAKFSITGATIYERIF